MNERVFSAEKNVLHELLVGERHHVVVAVQRVLLGQHGVDPTRVHPLHQQSTIRSVKKRWRQFCFPWPRWLLAIAFGFGWRRERARPPPRPYIGLGRTVSARRARVRRRERRRRGAGLGRQLESETKQKVIASKYLSDLGTILSFHTWVRLAGTFMLTFFHYIFSIWIMIFALVWSDSSIAWSWPQKSLIVANLKSTFTFWLNLFK